MRLPPLPGPVGVLDAERLAARAVGRPAVTGQPVVIADYDRAWPERYAVRARRIRGALGGAGAGHPEDRERYAAAKRRAAAEHGRSVVAYNAAKAAVVLDILRRAGLRPAGER